LSAGHGIGVTGLHPLRRARPEARNSPRHTAKKNIEQGGRREQGGGKQAARRPQRAAQQPTAPHYTSPGTRKTQGPSVGTFDRGRNCQGDAAQLRPPGKEGRLDAGGSQPRNMSRRGPAIGGRPMNKSVLPLGIFENIPCKECDGRAEVIASTDENKIKLRVVCEDCGRSTGYADLAVFDDDGNLAMVDTNAYGTVRAWWNMLM